MKEFLPFLKTALKSDDLEVIPLAGDASARRYFRVVKAQTSYVLMVWEPFVDDDSYPFLSVHRHLYKHDVSVPEIIAKSPKEGLVLLEDLGDLTLERKFWENQNQELALPYYKMAVDEIAKIHYGATDDKNPRCTAFQIEFDNKKLMWEMNYGWEHLLEKMCGLKIPTSSKEKVYELFNEICDTLANEPKHICHRDYHSRNLMLKFGKIRVIDFQDARLGPIQYDLVSLIKDSYVELNKDLGKTLLEYYFEKRKEAGHPKVTWEKFIEIYEIQSIQRCFKACGSFASFYNLRQDKRYLKYLPGTLNRVKNSLSLFPKYNLFLKVLTDHGLFEKKFDI